MMLQAQARIVATNMLQCSTKCSIEAVSGKDASSLFMVGGIYRRPLTGQDGL